MKLAILFWFYKEPEICQNRLELLRKYNPTTAIYGVYGGDLTTVDRYKSQLDPYVDDFYTFPEQKDTYWKWLQGDLILTQWYRERGSVPTFRYCSGCAVGYASLWGDRSTVCHARTKPNPTVWTQTDRGNRR